MLRRPPASKPAMRSLLLGCAYAAFLTSASTVGASEAEVVSKDNPSKSLSLILQDAERRGVLSSQQAVSTGQLSNRTKRSNSEPILATLPASCDDTHVLNFSDLKGNQSYEKVPDASEDDTENIAIARKMISLGLGLEAFNILIDNKSPEAGLLKELALLIDRHESKSVKPQLQNVKVCDNPSFIWATLATPPLELEKLGREDVRAMLQTLSEFPPHLREVMSIRLGILTAESGQVEISRRLWLSLNDFARQYDRLLPDEIMNDYSYLYLKGLLSEVDTPDKALAIFTYILQRDTLYRPAAMRRVQMLYQKSSSQIPEDIKAELVALGHQYSGQSESRQANMDLIAYQAGSGELDKAIAASQSKFSIHDAEYKQLVNLITEKLNGKLTATPLPTRMSGLNSYLSNSFFFEPAKLVNTLKYNALKVAVDANLPELWQQIYVIDPKEEKPLELLNEAKLLLAIKAGNMEASKTQDNAKTILYKIDYHIRNSEIESAKTLLKTLPESRLKADYKMHIAWLEGRWNTVSSYSNSPKSDGDDEVRGQELKSEAQKLAKLLADANTDTTGKTSINTIEDAEEFLGKIRRDLKTAREYIDNG